LRVSLMFGIFENSWTSELISVMRLGELFEEDSLT
jgi:hypothetical protein